MKRWYLKVAPILILLPLLVYAQDANQGDGERAEEQAILEQLKAARRKAQSSSAEAWKLVEGYGRATSIEQQQARDLALDRLSRPVKKGVKRRKPPYDVHDEYRRLLSYRSAILERLRRLDPKKYGRRRAPAAPKEALTLKIYDVQDLTYIPSDHASPNVGLGIGLDASGEAVLAFDEDEDDTSGVGIGAEKLIELLEGLVYSATDDDEGHIEVNGGRIVTRLRPSQHKKIERFLRELRRQRGGLIDLEVRVYQMPATLFIDLRRSSAALDKKSEARLLQAVKDKKVRLLSGHRVVAHDGQRVSVTRGSSRSIVADLEVNQTGVVPVINPQVSVLNEGLVVEVRPILDRVRNQVLLDVALSLSRIGEQTETREIAEVELELAKMEIARTSSSSCVPLGRGALLGGSFTTKEKDESLTCVVYVKSKLIKGK